ncbi:SDR family NAD(P)-dependent oxidoreductase, partial [Chlamydiota bacterium]
GQFLVVEGDEKKLCSILGVKGKKGKREVQRSRELVNEAASGQIHRLLAEHKKLSNLVRLWVKGVKIDWELLYEGDKRPKRISLPTYPFAKERYWIEKKEEKAIFDEHEKIDYTNERLLLEKGWKEERKGKDGREVKGTIVILITREKREIASKLFGGLGEVRVVYVESAKSYKREDNGYKMNFGKVKDGNRVARQVLERSEDVLVGIIDLSDIGGEEESVGYMGKIGLLQGIIEGIKEGQLAIIHITKGLQKFKTKENSLLGGKMSGFIKMLSAEYSKVKAKTIDIGGDVQDIKRLREIVFQELVNKDLVGEVCYRGGKRYIPCMKVVERQKEVTENFMKDVIDKEQVVVITGGVRGIGSEIARYLADKGVKKLVLMGRKDFPKREEWEKIVGDKDGDKDIIEKIRKVQELEKAGVEVSIYTGTLTDKGKLTAYFEETRNKMGAIGGVVHCAGVLIEKDPAFIHKKEEDIRKVYEPKVEGLEILGRVFEKDKLAFFILFSSISGVIPVLGAGVSDYAAANSFMDHFAGYQHRKGKTYYRSINWPNWEGGGMGEATSPRYNELGLKKHTIAEGIELLEEVMALEGKSNILPCLAERGVLDLEKLFLVKYEGRTQEKKQIMKEGAEKKEVTGDLLEETIKWLRGLFSKKLKIAEDKLGDEVGFGELGVDSILIAELVKRAEGEIGRKIDPSVFLEYPTLLQLSQYLGQTYQEEISKKLLGLEEAHAKEIVEESKKVIG